METIAHYQIKSHLQQSHNANLYLAHDPSTGRDLVLKTPLENEPIYGTLFISEAVISLDINHPHAPRYYDYRTAGGQPYLAMEFIEGWSLIEILENQTDFLPEEEVINWGIAVCDLLIYLHGRYVVHGDLKPGNLMLDQYGNLRAIDFGLAHKLPFGASQIQGVAMGTEGYSPPEQYDGIMSVTGDIYALGATLHHLITGRDPREPNCQFQFHTYPPRALNPYVSAAFEAVILKATEYKAADRYQNAAEMRAVLLACRI